jgi:hypothetical protein
MAGSMRDYTHRVMKVHSLRLHAAWAFLLVCIARHTPAALPSALDTALHPTIPAQQASRHGSWHTLIVQPLSAVISHTPHAVSSGT